MSTETTGDGGQAPTTGTPGEAQAATGEQDQQQAGAQAASQQEALTDDTPLDSIPEGVRAYVAHLRKEAAAQRTAARQASEQVQQFQRQSETDQQRQEREATEARERLERLERENRDLRVGRAVQDAAKDAHNPSTLWELMQARGIDVETDDNGKPVNVAAVVAALRESDPYLFKAPRVSTDGGAGGGQTRATQSAGDQINDMLRGRTTSAAR